MAAAGTATFSDPEDARETGEPRRPDEPDAQDAQEPDEPCEQAEYNVGSAREPRSAMDDAVSAAVGVGVPGGERPSAGEIAAARERAAQMLQSLSQEDADGLRDLQNLSLSLGLPAARAIFGHMLVASRLRGAAKADAKREIAGLSPVTEVGCMKVDYHDRTTGVGRTAYLLLDQCPKAHNLDAQLNKLKQRVADDKWPLVLRHLSTLINIGRLVYSNLAASHRELVQRLAKGRDAEFLSLQVDPHNTTLYLDPSWPNRVGIYIRLAEEVAEER